MTLNLTKLTGSAKFENQIFSLNEMKQIGQSTGLLGISFINCPIIDEHILQFSKLPKLVNVLLENTSITDKSLEYLSHLPNLKYLFITKADITGEGFKYFVDHKKLDCIWACSTKLNDNSLKFIAQIPKLGTVRILDTLVTFNGLLSIAHNPRIHIVAGDIFSKEQIELFEQQQRTLAKKSIIKDDSEIKIAKERLLAFFNAVTEWEKYASEVFTTTKKSYDDLSIKCKEIFKTYCIDKPRAGYRPNGLSFSDGPNYTYGQEKLIDSEQASKNKIIFYTKDHLDFKYRYILIKKDEVWKIDERQRQSGGWKKCGL
jgi:hypothetical protein